MRACLDGQYAEDKATIELLKDNNAIMDWKKVMSDTWLFANGQQLSLFAAFLMNYAGPTPRLEALLHDFVRSPQITADLEQLHSIASLLSQIPHRSVNAVIFSVLTAAVAKNPQLLDKTLMEHLAYYHHRVHLKNKTVDNPLQAALNLMRHFGQQQHYMAAAQCCHLLKSKTKNELFLKQVQKIHTEALIEAELYPHKNSWYFSILSFFKRLWHYPGKASGFICFSENKINYIKPIVPGYINTEVIGRQQIEKNKKLLAAAKKFKTHKLLNKKEENNQLTPARASEMGVFKPSLSPERGLSMKSQTFRMK